MVGYELLCVQAVCPSSWETLSWYSCSQEEGSSANSFHGNVDCSQNSVQVHSPIALLHRWPLKEHQLLVNTLSFPHLMELACLLLCYVKKILDWGVGGGLMCEVIHPSDTMCMHMHTNKHTNIHADGNSETDMCCQGLPGGCSAGFASPATLMCHTWLVVSPYLLQQAVRKATCMATPFSPYIH